MPTYSKTILLGGSAGTVTYDIPVQEPVIRYAAFRVHAVAVGLGEVGQIYMALLDGETYIAPRGGLGGNSVPNDGLLIAFYDIGATPPFSGPKVIDWPESFRMRGPSYDLKLRVLRTAGLSGGYGNLILVTSQK